MLPPSPPAVIAASPAPSQSTDPSAEDLEEIEKALAAPAGALNVGGITAQRNFQSLNPDISFILDTALAAFSVAKPLQTGGHDPNRTGFNFQQLEMSLASAVDPFMTFTGNVVFVQAGVEIEEAYLHCPRAINYSKLWDTDNIKARTESGKNPLTP